MYIRPIVQATKHTHSPSLALAAGGLLGFAALMAGLWHPRSFHSGVTQVGREATVTFEDGSVMVLTEPESDLDILRRRRLAGWGGHEYRRTFIKSDGTEVDLGDDGYAQFEDNDGLDTGDHLILTAYRRRVAKAGAPLDKADGVVVADLHVDGKDKVVASANDPKDRVVTDVIDSKDYSKDVVFRDSKDVLDQPVFALTTTNPYTDGDGVLMALLGDPGSMWGDIRTAASTGILNGGGTGGNGTGGNSGSNPTTPIGVAVPEPSTWSLMGLAGVLALAVGVRRRMRAA